MTTTIENKNRYTTAYDITLADASRADYNSAALNGYRYSLRRYLGCLREIDEIDTELSTLGCHAIRYDRVQAGKSSNPNRQDPQQIVIDAMDRKDGLEVSAAFWSAEMEKAHRIIRDLMRTTDADTVDMTLRYYDMRETYREIAARYGLSIATVRARIMHALADV